ncbi:MAG TPA: hypothetical protein ENN13_00140 [Candidatus Altiarchaeales archaeon]|nr:hypothetical protein [Candidatus Altiarchaeales archaeon]
MTGRHAQKQDELPKVVSALEALDRNVGGIVPKDVPKIMVIPEKGYMREYRKWLSENNLDFKVTPVIQFQDPLTGERSFLVELAYGMHQRPSAAINSLMNHFRAEIPREKTFSICFGTPQGEEFTRLSPLTDYLNVADQIPNNKGDVIKFYVDGDLTPQQKEKMGWAMACMLSDPSFDYGLGVHKPAEKFLKIKEVIRPL